MDHSLEFERRQRRYRDFVAAQHGRPAADMSPEACRRRLERVAALRGIALAAPAPTPPSESRCPVPRVFGVRVPRPTVREVLAAGGVVTYVRSPRARRAERVVEVAGASKLDARFGRRRRGRVLLQGVDAKSAKLLGFRQFTGWVTVPECWRERGRGKRRRLVAYDLTERCEDPMQTLRPCRMPDGRLLPLPSDVPEERFLARMKARA